jgi:hypothetical protein
MPRKTKGYPTRGRPKGYKLPARSIERIRDSINAKLCIDTLHAITQNGTKEDSVRAQAAGTLLQFALPKLTATDLTSGGEAITVERVSFKDGK